jgi:hypothetical protein
MTVELPHALAVQPFSEAFTFSTGGEFSFVPPGFVYVLRATDEYTGAHEDDFRHFTARG